MTMEKIPSGAGRILLIEPGDLASLESLSSLQSMPCDVIVIAPRKGVIVFFDEIEPEPPQITITALACTALAADRTITLERAATLDHHCGPCGNVVKKRGQLCQRCQRRRTFGHR